MKRLKRFCFGQAGVLMLVLIVATLLEKQYGRQCVAHRIYGAVWFVSLWGLLAVASLVYLFRRRLQRRPAAFLLHLSFAVILAGAFVTWMWGRQGTLHLRKDGIAAVSFSERGGRERPLPFRVALGNFRVEYYPGTRAPMDYVSDLTLVSGVDTLRREVAMNRIVRFQNYRFYQSSYDEDGEGTTLSVAHDPWGIGITYTGYGLLLLSMIAFVCDRRSGLRRLLRYPLLSRAALGLLFAGGAVSARAATSGPQVLPRDVARDFGNLYVYYNDRICPLATLAKDFTVKLYGGSRYEKYTPEQVLSGWLFYYDDWKLQPMIRVKDAGMRRDMGLAGRYARLVDFSIVTGNYAVSGLRDHREAGEKLNLVNMVCGGGMLRLFPYNDPADSLLRWASQIDELPRDLPHEQWLFIRRAMDYVNELVAKRDYAKIGNVLRKIRNYQQNEANGQLPSEGRFYSEKLYNRLDYMLPFAAGYILIGVVAFVYVCRRMVQRRTLGRNVRFLLLAGLAAGSAYLLLLLGLRGYMSGHWPLSNGYETMQFLACCALLLTLVFHRRFFLLLPFGYLVGGLAAMVSMMGASTPQLTPLIPVLNSPLLCIHVMLVMIAYALFAFVMCNGVAGMVLSRKRSTVCLRLQVVGKLMLYVAVFCLAAGIFVGAVWANVSWGRYWGWDPKEVWALITLLVYALALHGDSLPWFRRPVFFHGFCIVAFLTVLITYFGVNFLLGGVHSYAV